MKMKLWMMFAILGVILGIVYYVYMSYSFAEMMTIGLLGETTSNSDILMYTGGGAVLSFILAFVCYLRKV
jgi:hypothetical protein